MSSPGLAERLDQAISDFLSNWNVGTIIIATIIISIFVVPFIFSHEPDTHPFLLARQAQPAPVRQEDQSAVYRATDIPYGYPLRAGLAIKDLSAPRWSSGRNGDLRDVWRQALRGPVEDDGSPAGSKGSIFTILGKQKIIERSVEDITLEINAVGKYIDSIGGKEVIVSLSNSVELLAAIFAGSFYGFKVTLIPYGLADDELDTVLSQTSATVMIAEAGSIQLGSGSSGARSIKNIVWVVKGGNQHMEWSDPAGQSKGVSATSWQDIVQQGKSSVSAEVAPYDKDSSAVGLSIFAYSGGGYKMFEYSAANLVSGTAALAATLTRTNKLKSSDLLLPVMSLTDSYALCWIFAALFANASIALNSVAGDTIGLELASLQVSPTIIVASSGSIEKYYTRLLKSTSAGGLGNYLTARSLRRGHMPDISHPALITTSFTKLRALMISEPSETKSGRPKLSSNLLSDLRIITGARTGYALTDPAVAGAVCQTQILDYRDKGSVMVCVGPPVTSVEICLTGEEFDMASEHPKGKVLVKGPAVIGDHKTVLNINAQIDHDNTLLVV